MNCQQVRELLPAYVLGALEGDEVDAVEAHLKTGNEHDDELVDLRATVFALDRFADERSLAIAEAPRRRWLARLTSPGRRAEPASRGTSLPVWQLALAAAVMLAIFGSGWLAAQLAGGETKHDVAVVVQGSGGQLVSLNGVTSQDSVSVTMSGFQRLPTDRVYQIWAIRDGEWLKMGVCNPNPAGRWEGEFPFRITPGERIAVTIEPSGGSDHPTSTPLLTSSS